MALDLVTERTHGHITHAWRFATSEEILNWYEICRRSILDSEERVQPGLVRLLDQQFGTHMHRLEGIS
jgi:hypothetical protein